MLPYTRELTRCLLDSEEGTRVLPNFARRAGCGVPHEACSPFLTFYARKHDEDERVVELTAGYSVCFVRPSPASSIGTLLRPPRSDSHLRLDADQRNKPLRVVLQAYCSLFRQICTQPVSRWSEQRLVLRLHQYDNKQSFFGDSHPLSQKIGYPLVIGLSIFFTILTIAFVQIDRRWGGTR